MHLRAKTALRPGLQSEHDTHIASVPLPLLFSSVLPLFRFLPRPDAPRFVQSAS